MYLELMGRDEGVKTDPLIEIKRRLSGFYYTAAQQLNQSDIQ